MKNPTDMTTEEIEAEGKSIYVKFDQYNHPNPYWDWPTMTMIFPEDCQRYHELGAEWRTRHRLYKNLGLENET